MMKKLLVSGILVGGSFALMGCEEGTIVYEGEGRPISEVEEIIADKLEVENPGMDIEVNIVEEAD